MNKQVELAAEERVLLRKKVKRLRRMGIVPASLNSRNRPSVSLQVDGNELRKILAQGHGTQIIQLKVGNRPPVQTIVKDIQHEPISGKIAHVEFNTVAASEPLKTRVPLHFLHEAPGARQSGVTMLRSLDDVMVSCLPADLPANIPVDLSVLTAVGDVIRVGDLQAAPGVTILAEPDQLVVALSHLSKQAVEELPAAAKAVTEKEAPVEEVEEKTEDQAA